MSFDPAQNHFALFGLPPAFDLDPAQLGERFRELQRAHHPDRFAAADERQQHLAVQRSAHINQAYEVLSSPVERARYLLQLKGVDAGSGSATTSDGAFLMQQMEWREAMMELGAGPEALARLERLKAEVERVYAGLQREFVALLQAQDWPRAHDAVLRMQFVQKMLASIDTREEALWDA